MEYNYVNLEKLIDSINQKIAPDKLTLYVGEDKLHEVLYVDHNKYPEKAYDVRYGSGIKYELTPDDYKDEYENLKKRYEAHTI
jgi:hypothetical protein